MFISYLEICFRRKVFSVFLKYSTGSFVNNRAMTAFVSSIGCGSIAICSLLNTAACISRAPPPFFSQVVWWMVTSSGECDGDRASAVRLGQDLVSHRLLIPICAGYDRPKDDLTFSSSRSGGGGDFDSGDEDEGDHFRSFDDAVGWLFAFAGDALRNPFAPPPPTQVAVMANTRVDVAVTGWTEVCSVNNMVRDPAAL